MKRMKKFRVDFTLNHESFGGYDHCDGVKSFEVEAASSRSAKNKAEFLLKKQGGLRGQWISNTSIKILP